MSASSLFSLLHAGALSPDALFTRDAWPLEWPVVAGVIGALGLYARGVHRVWHRAGRGRGVAHRQVTMFAAGIACLVVALCSPLAAVGASLFAVHMVQHLVLMQVAAPLLVLGAPGVAFAWALPRITTRLVHVPVVRATRRVVARPLVAWSLHALAVVGWHLPPAFAWALRSDLGHAAQHVSFLGTALLFWSTTGLASIGHRGAPRRAAHLIGALGAFAAGVYGAVLGATFTLSDTVIYREYARRSLAWGVSPMDDQQAAGLIMWLGGGVLSLASAIALAAVVLRTAPQTTVRRDALRLPRLRAGRSAGGAPLFVLVAVGSAVLCAAVACSDPELPRDGRVATDREEAVDLRIVVISRDERSALVRGALLGGTEGARAASLMHRAVSVMRVPDLAALPRAEAAAVVVIGGQDDAECRAIDAQATRRRWLYMNVLCGGPWLRDTDSHPFAMHIAATPAMTRGAVVPVTLWRENLQAFGAAQLNARYRTRFGAPMNDTAWGAWMAVKAAVETMLREPTAVQPASMRAYMTRLDVAFDGHKGEPLRFGADDHQLRQPVYARAAEGATPDAQRRNAIVSESAAAVETFTAIPPDVPLVVVSNEGSASLSVVHATTHVVLGVVPLPGRPRGIQSNDDGERVLVAISDADPTQERDHDVIGVVNVRTGVLESRIRGGSDPEQFARVPAGNALLIANEDAGLATLVPQTGRGEPVSLAVGIEPEGVAVSPDGAWGLVTAETSNTLSVIDLHRRVLSASILVDVRPRAVVVSPDNRRAYVTNEISGTVSVVSLPVAGASAADVRVSGTIDLGERTKPVGMALSADGNTLLVALGGAHALSVIDTRTLREQRRVPVQRRPWNVVLSPAGNEAWVANGASGSVSVLRTATWTVLATIPVGERPWGVAYLAPNARARRGGR